MPRKSKRQVARRGRRRTRGGMFGMQKVIGWLGKANAYLKKHKTISKVGHRLSGMHPVIKGATGIAKSMGYGRRKRGRGFRLTGAGCRGPVGMGRRACGGRLH